MNNWFAQPGAPGDRTFEQQMTGLGWLKDICQGRTILDFGCAEGLIGIEMLKHGAFKQDNIAEHYDLSNDFFALFLDPSMMYSAARWPAHAPALSLEDAQREKNDALCRKLQLRASDHVLEIGTGWGVWSLHAAKTYGCRVTTVTISQAQHDYAVRRIAAAGLAERVDVQLRDFRDLNGQFDKIVSIEMMEALGHRYQEDFARVVARCHEIRNTEKLRKAGADAIVSPDFTGGLRIASAMIRPHVVSFLDQMLKSDENLRVEEVVVPSGFSEKPISQLSLPDRNHIMLAVRDGSSWIFNPEENHPLRPGMTLVIMATPEGRRAVESALGWI